MSVWGAGGIGEQSLAVEDKQLVDTIGQYLVLYLTLDTCTGNNGMEALLSVHWRVCDLWSATPEILPVRLYLLSHNIQIRCS